MTTDEAIDRLFAGKFSSADLIKKFGEDRAFSILREARVRGFRFAPKVETPRCNGCGGKIDREGRWCSKCWSTRQRPVTAPEEPKPIRAIAADSEPGKSSGKVRKSMAYGNAENANGFWDNLVGAMEDGE